ncbi:hypothetical protein KMW28_05000 [Flammeovirga yaeyamensis]|uniref:SMODS-associating 2TM beta-strand rich effector domain-containing protein n=1 Tax=Flammeovirga yaeyamensis TaxID=367791 RepID=A0AAX1N655_9BACT|nr:hypothetical protein [Flammeovirga yaeyamensis]MBB3697515.1 hypothetical protein [Flammeovirga yaeyamensis]NMF36210.1 hypothetical protein [Flammeovirga yaeyamensis]QWG02940.1 hypothetical protein KMW28_05000 [Flammeovirga yaeyamensis]
MNLEFILLQADTIGASIDSASVASAYFNKVATEFVSESWGIVSFIVLSAGTGALGSWLFKFLTPRPRMKISPIIVYDKERKLYWFKIVNKTWKSLFKVRVTLLHHEMIDSDTKCTMAHFINLEGTAGQGEITFDGYKWWKSDYTDHVTHVRCNASTQLHNKLADQDEICLQIEATHSTTGETRMFSHLFTKKKDILPGHIHDSTNDLYGIEQKLAEELIGQ